MSDFERVAIVGTGQVAGPERTDTPVDELVVSDDRERALLLRAGAFAVLVRAARPALRNVARPAPAPDETLRPASAKLAELLAPLFATTDGVLDDALAMMENARMRLPAELLPIALQQRSASLRDRLRPLLGERGRWLARTRDEWRWAHEPEEGNWEEATAAERKLVLAQVRDADPARARALVEASWKTEKADQRLAWLEALEHKLSLDDEAFLSGVLSDRSQPTRVAAARLLWRLPTSALSMRLRERVEAWLGLETAGMFGKLVGAAPTLKVELPPETFDDAWAREGIQETPPHGVGRRQWWLAQMLAVVPPDHWCARFGQTAAQLVAAAAKHDLAAALIEGFTNAALRHSAEAWFAPLYDACAQVAAPKLSFQALPLLAARLTRADAERRMLGLLDNNVGLLLSFATPWSPRFAKRFLDMLPQPSLAPILPAAALAIPIELLPASLPVPEFPENDHAARSYLRALDQFQTTASARRAIAQEITP